MPTLKYGGFIHAATDRGGTMKLRAFHYIGPRALHGCWDIEVSLDGTSRHEDHSGCIERGVSADFVHGYATSDPTFIPRLLSGELRVSVDQHPWGAGNEWYFTPLAEGLVVEHQWSEDFQRGGVGWYTWDLVRAVIELTQWNARMGQNPSGLGADALKTACFALEVPHWQPLQSLTSLGWKSFMD
jgi:hypothetical protein